MIRPVIGLTTLFVSILQISCSTKNCDSSTSEGKVLQIYAAENVVVKTNLVDHGASGNSVTLSICDNSRNQLIEEVGLRAEDYLPTIDSVVGSYIYIHYSFPRYGSLLKFEDVVLGEALIHKEKLKYRYIFSNLEN